MIFRTFIPCLIGGLSTIFLQAQVSDSDSGALRTFHESFESDSWFRAWGSQDAPRNVRLVSEREAITGFVPLKGAALQISVDAGGHYGTSFQFAFKKQWGAEPEEIHFRYYLRLASDWAPHRGGKFPGISGTYGKAGWGGRPAHGDDGWSARGLFEGVQDGGTPIGFYCYHADMKGKYGENWRWNHAGNGILKPNQWYCIEQYAKLNTPGQKDGILKAWVDGELAFEKKDVCMRHVDDLKIEAIWMNLYYGGTWTAPSDMHLFVDEVVISQEKIGKLSNANKQSL